MDLSGIIPTLDNDIEFVSEVKFTQGKVIIDAKNITLHTRTESFDRILEGLGERQKSVYRYLKQYANGATAKELSVAMFDEGLVASPERNSVHPRLNELVEMGLVKVVGKKTCQYTDRSVAIYKN